tara:strand:+ start:209 stop:532 length:324 start_codon:yes stop_codon:yes gene_type:complete
MSKSDFRKEIYIIITNEKNKKKACKLGNLLLKDKLISCVSFKDIESHFWWEDKINKSREVQLMIKCKKENVYKVCNKISDWHSYQVPEIIYFSVSSNEKYHYWINSI